MTRSARTRMNDRLGEALADHLDRHFGESPDGVREAAREALDRRWAKRVGDRLEVVARPAAGGAGRYRVGAGGSARPYNVQVRSVRPLWVACDCPDYLSGGLGVCKHGLAALHAISEDEARWDALARGRGRPVPVRWSPIWAPDAPSDWLDGVCLDPEALPGPPPRWAEREGPEVRVRSNGFRRGAPRAAIVERLAALSAGRNADPSVHAWLRHEREARAREESLAHARRRQASALKKLGVTLRTYQREAVRRFLENGRLLLADDMGLGKTVQAAAIAHVLGSAGAAPRVLIIAPASLKAQWCAEWRRLVPEREATPVTGARAQREEIYAKAKRAVLVANYEQLHRDLDLIAGWGPALVILDEGQRIKNWPTRVAQTVKRIDAPFRLVLTGTPIENRLDELMSILDWLDPYAVAPKWRLPAEHLDRDLSGDAIGMRHLEALRRRLAHVVLRRTRDEVLHELPPRQDQTHAVEVTQAQREAHEDLTAPIARLVAASRRRPLTQSEFLRLMQLLTAQRMIANGLGLHDFTQVWPEVRMRQPTERLLASLDAPKLDYLRSLIAQLAVEQGRKVVVFSQWRRFLQLAHWASAPALEAAGVEALFFSGEESQALRAHHVERFHDDPAVRVLWCTDAGGVGLNLQKAAHVCVHTEVPWNPAVFEQRVARVHRMGQTEPVEVHTLVSPGTIESVIAAKLATKRQLFEGVFDGDTDTILFGERSGMSAIQALFEDAPPAAADDAGGEIEADVDAALDEEAFGAAPSAAAVVEARTAPRALEGRGADGGRTALAAAELLGALSVERRDDGSLRIDAPPEVAGDLATLLRGMAALLDRVSHGGGAP